MSKRTSGPPRRPRNPVAKAVRTPQYRMRVVPDKRFRARREEPRLEDEANKNGAEGEEYPTGKDEPGGV